MRDIWRRASRAYYRAEWWTGRCFAYALRGIVGRTQNWGLVGGGIVGFAADAWGFKMTSLEGWQGALVSGAAGIGAAWVILVVARLLIAPFRMWKGGKWYGREFVYDEPRLAIAIRASQDTNNFVHHFKFPDAPPFALIKYTIERATPYLHHVQVDVHPHWRGLRVMNADYLSGGELGRGSFYGGGSFRVRADRRMCASTFMRPQIDPTMVRIKITGWEL